MSELSKYSEQTFEAIKHYNENGQEYWFARELQGVLQYSQWRYMSEVITRARLACKNSGIDPDDHFADVRKMVQIRRRLRVVIRPARQQEDLHQWSALKKITLLHASCTRRH